MFVSIKSCYTFEDKKVTLKKFHGKVLLDIREFYVDKLSREMKPGLAGDLFLTKNVMFFCSGKKGISLSQEQVKEFKSLFKVLDESFPTFEPEKDFIDPLA